MSQKSIIDTNNPNDQNKIYDKISFILSTHYIDFLNTKIEDYKLFNLLEITHFKNPIISKKTKYKIKIKYPGKPNCVFSASYKGMVRGIKTNLGKKHLKNGICLYITSSSEESIHVKILKSSLGISGAKNKGMVEEVAEYIKKRIFSAQKMINRIRRIDSERRTLNWVKEKTKGKKVEVIKGSLICINNGEKIIDREGTKGVLEGNNFLEIETIHSIVVPDEFKNGGYPKDIDSKIADFLIDKVFDYSSHSTYTMLLDVIYKFESVVVGDLNYDQVKTSMIFTNFNIGFKIDLKKLYLTDSRKFVVIQDDDNTKFVKIQMKYEIPDKLKDKIKCNPKHPNVHTFHVYRGGRITQSSPHEDMGKIAHDEFVQFIFSIKDDIISEDID